MSSYISLPSLRTFTFRFNIAQRQRRWQVYELAKRNWDEHHPDASPAERDAAILEITRRLGIAQ